MRNYDTPLPPPPAGLEGITSRFSFTTTDPVAPPGGLSARVRDRQDGQPYFMRAIPRARVTSVGVDRFRDFTDELSRLGHPHLLFPTRIEETADWILLLRELGPPRHLLEAVPVDDQHLLIQSLISLTGALGALHEAGHVHGMPKPSRLRIEGADGRLDRVALVDPGLHLLTGSPDLSTQHRYWAPETQDNGVPTPASDLYTIGASFLELVGGRAALDRLRTGGQPRFHDVAPEFDPDLCRLLDRLLLPEPDRRPAGGLAFWKELHDPIWSLPERSPEVALWLTADCVGREAELARVEAVLFGECGARALEVCGPQGSGRSRMLREIAGRARRRQWQALHWTHAGPGDGLPALLEAVAAASGLPTPGIVSARDAAGIAGRVDDLPEAARHGAFVNGMREVAGNLEQPLLILIDDLDRLSRATIAGLHYFVAEFLEAPIRIVATGRQRLHFPGAEVIELEPFDLPATRRFLLPLLSEALNPEETLREMHRAAGGRPQWLRLLLATWLANGRLSLERGRPFFDSRAAGATPGISAIVAELLERLDADARRLLECVAVLGEPLGLRLVRRLSADAAHLLELPEVAALVETRDGTVIFTAEAARDAVLDHLEAGDAHQRCQQLIAILDRDRTEAGLWGRIAVGAGRLEDGVRQLLRAARLAERAGDRRAALSFYKQVLAHPAALAVALGSQPPATLASSESAAPPEIAVPPEIAAPPETEEPLCLRLHAADLAVGLGDDSWAWEITEGAIELLPPEAERLGEIYLRLADIACQCRRGEDASRFYAAARSHADDALRLRIDLAEAANDIHRRDLDVAAERMESVVARLAEWPLPGDKAMALNRLLVIRQAKGRVKEARLLGLRAYRHAVRASNPVQLTHVLNNLAIAYRALGRHQDALDTLERGRQLLRRHPHDPCMMTNAAVRGHVCLDLQRGEEAERSYSLALAIRRRRGMPGDAVADMIGIALAQAAQCRHQDACRTLLTAEAEAIEVGSRRLTLARANLGTQLSQLGDFAAAELLLQQALDDRRLTPAERALIELNIGELGMLRGDPGWAVLHLERALSVLQRLESPYSFTALALLARARLDSDEIAAAEREVARGLAVLADQVTLPPDVRARWVVSVALVQAARTGEWLRELEPAFEEIRDLSIHTLRGLLLISAIEAVLARSPDDAATEHWIAERLRELERVSGRTDSPLLPRRLAELRRSWEERQLRDDRTSAPQPASPAPQPASPVPQPASPAPQLASPVHSVASAVAMSPALVEENRLLRQLVLGSQPDLRTMPEGICADPILSDLVDRVSHLRPTLLEGETGLGRVRLTLGVHHMQGRRVPILPVLCSADPDALAVSSLRGSPGDSPFERARGGTLVLCDIEELSDDSLTRLKDWLAKTDGGRDCDVWLVGTTRPAAFATNLRGRDLARRLLAALGQAMELPPLRRRLEALPLLIDALLAEACRPANRVLPRVPEQFVELCGKHHWPGNIAELRQVVRHAVELARRGVLSVAPIPRSHPQAVTPYREAAGVFERRVLTQALEASAGRVHEAARLLGLPESTFRYKARKLKLRIKDPG